MFKEKADVLHINEFDDYSPDLLDQAAKHKEKIEEAQNKFPEIEVTNEFPKAN